MTNEEALKELTGKSIAYPTDKSEEALKMALEALEKQIPKKPIRGKFKDALECANCGSQVGYSIVVDGDDGTPKRLFADAFCSGCGQRQDWSEDD